MYAVPRNGQGHMTLIFVDVMSALWRHTVDYVGCISKANVLHAEPVRLAFSLLQLPLPHPGTTLDIADRFSRVGAHNDYSKRGCMLRDHDGPLMCTVLLPLNVLGEGRA